MKKLYLACALLILSLVGTAFALTVEAPVDQTTDIKLGYGRTVTVKAIGGTSPYSFYGTSCVTLSSGGDDDAYYTAPSTAGTCSTYFEDLDFFTGNLNFNVTCVCDYCTTDTDGAMTNSGNVTFGEVAYGPDEPETPEDGSVC